jgi:hypothetical protein
MSPDERQSGGRFFFKQAILLVVTIILVAFCTIPLMQAVKWVLNPGELKADVKMANEAVASFRTKLDVANSKMLMGAGDDEAQEKMKKQVEELKQQVAVKELENKYLQNQIVLAQTLAELAKLKSAAAPAPVVDTGQEAKKPENVQGFEKLIDNIMQKLEKLLGTGQKVAELLIKLFGSLGSIFTGAMFVVSWVKKRRQPPQAAAQVASK